MVYYIGFHELKRKNNYPVSFLLHQESKVKLKTDLKVKRLLVLNKIHV